MYALLYIGLLLEPYLGKVRFITAYLLTGIIASIASLWWHDLTISAGASGAIFGMYGVFLAMLTTNLIEKSARRALLTSIVVFVGYNLLNGMKGGIDNAAHIGGLVGGLVIGYAYVPSLKKPGAPNLKYSTIGALTLLTILISSIVYNKIPNDIGKYDKKMRSFVSMEAMALELYSLPQDTPNEKILSEIKDKGIYYWNENIKLLNDVEKLNLPDELHNKNKKLLHYCDLRIKSYGLLYKAVEQNTDIYKDSIEFYNKEIEATIEELKEK
jgi:rhomboid protease GluP